MTATKPMPMLSFVRQKPCQRQLKFFTYHCCRLAWPTIADERSQRAVETAERFMVGLATEQQLAEAVQAATAACEEAYAAETNRAPADYSRERYSRSLGTALAVRALVHGYTYNVVAKARDALFFRGAIHSRAQFESLFAEMGHALRDIFGNPFRPVTLDPSWLTSDVVALARGIYDERAFDRMPILADALQDAGCDNGEVLDHCRGDGPHVRGCWVVDMLLGKS